MAQNSDLSYAGPAMAGLSRQAQLFERKEIDSMVKFTSALLDAYAHELPTADQAADASLRSVAGHVARSVNTAVQAALMPPSQAD